MSSNVEIYSRVIILLVLLVLSALFSSSETAITAVSLAKIRQLKEENEKQANTLKRVKIKMGDILSTILIGNNVVNIAATAILADLLIIINKNKGVSAGGSSTLITTIVMTILILIFGEITPKSFATQNPIKVAVKVARPLEILAVIFKPILVVLTLITNIIIKMLGGKVLKNGPFVTEEEIRSLVDVGEEEGIIKHEEKEMIQNIFEIDGLEVGDVMLPRIDMIALDEETTIREALDLIIECGHSRIPVYKETIDDIVGVLYAKDLLPFSFYKCDSEELREKSITELMRQAYYVPETKKANLLLKELQLKQTHIAIVLDEYGGTEGLVTIEDILEEIVGDIFDEYDNEIDLIEKVDEFTYLIQADVSLEEINTEFGLDLPEEDFETLGGYVFNTLGRVPVVGDTLEHENMIIEVTTLLNRRVIAIKLTIKHEGEGQHTDVD